MRQAQGSITIQTHGQGHHHITNEVRAWIEAQGMSTGVLTVFIQHVAASLTIREHADRDDLHTFFRRLEGMEEMVERRAALYTAQLSIPIRDGGMVLGARQGLFVYEYRDGGYDRHLVLHLIGE